MTRCVIDGCSEPRSRIGRCPEHAREYERTWRAAHPGYMREYMRRREGYYEKETCSEPACRCQPYRDGLCRQHAPRLERRPRASLTPEQRAEARRAKDAAYRDRHRSQRRAQDSAYRQTHPDKVYSSSAARRARTRRAFVEHISRESVLERDGWRCQLCHRRIYPHLKHPHPGSASIDHIVPLSKGGKHEYRNVQAAHLRCNHRKRAAVYGPAEQLRLIA